MAAFLSQKIDLFRYCCDGGWTTHTDCNGLVRGDNGKNWRSAIIQRTTSEKEISGNGSWADSDFPPEAAGHPMKKAPPQLYVFD